MDPVCMYVCMYVLKTYHRKIMTSLSTSVEQKFDYPKSRQREHSCYNWSSKLCKWNGKNTVRYQQFLIININIQP